MARTEAGLGLKDIFYPTIENFELAKVRIIQPDLSISFSRALYPFRGLLINPGDRTLWIMYGSPDEEATLQTIGYTPKSTEIQLSYQDIPNGLQRTVKINL